VPFGVARWSEKVYNYNLMSIKKVKPYLVFSDEKGNVYEDLNYYAVGRTGFDYKPIYSEKLIELPEGSDLFVLPQRKPLGLTKDGKLKVIEDVTAVAAFLAPAHTQLLLSAYKKDDNAPVLPLFAYTAVGWYDGKFYAPAVRIDPDKRQEPYLFEQQEVIRKGKLILKRFPKNRLILHVVKDCAFAYFCPAARNFVLGRFEAPLPTSPFCNSRCLGCISFQNKAQSPIKCTQPRIKFTPTPEEIAEAAVFHLERAKNPVVSFGQGCEGEPLLVGEVILDGIKLIRKKTSKGVINLNTNGSLPQMVDTLFKNGLDSIRVSLNSVLPKVYESYYKPVNYSFDDVVKTLAVGRQHNKWVSLNYFVLPGMTDQDGEYQALREIIKNTRINMIQWRNFNIDPDWYFEHLGISGVKKGIGVLKLMDILKKEFPNLHYGYFNPHKDVISSILPA